MSLQYTLYSLIRNKTRVADLAIIIVTAIDSILLTNFKAEKNLNERIWLYLHILIAIDTILWTNFKAEKKTLMNLRETYI